MNDVALNKKVSIERCLAQVRRFYAEAGDVPFADDHLRQDAIAMNLQRACEQAIDLANHAIKLRKLGLPQSSRESFELLREAGLIDSDLCARMEKMVGFRNVLVHQYQQMDIQVLVTVIEKHLDDMLNFAQAVAASLA